MRRVGTIAAVLLVLPAVPAPAQVTTEIVREGSLGDPSLPLAIEDLNGDRVYEIGEAHGSRYGSDLFHRLRLFNVGAGDTALFTADPSLVTRNVVAGITGGVPSSIFGTIASDIPGASLYLLNPSGWLFGPGAGLDVQGSFHLSTADGLGFQSGGRFEVAPSGLPEVAFEGPVAFGFLGVPAPISIQGRLEVPAGEGLSLVGGPLEISGGWLEARSGRIDLASVGSSGKLIRGDLDAPDPLDASSFASLGRIDIDSGARVDASGDAAGAVFIRGGPIRIDDSSVLATHRGADPNAGRLSLKSDDSIRVTNGAFLEVGTEGAGPGGEADVTAPALLIDAGGIASTSIAGASGDAGTITVMADSLELRSGGVIGAASEGIGGHAGAIQVTAGSLALLDGGVISAVSEEAGADAGTIRVSADSLVVESPIQGRRGGLAAGTGGAGNAGSIRIDARDVSLSDGAFVAADAWAGSSGDAGAVEVEAESLRVVGADSGIFAGVLGRGRAGTIDVTAQSLEISDGGNLSVGTAPGGGDAGATRITAGSLALRDGGLITAESYGRFLAGNAGTVLVSADSFVVESPVQGRPGGISVSTFGVGDAGSIRIDARDVSLSDQGFVAAATLPGSSGDGGSIEVEAESLRVHAHALISAATQGRGDAGTIDLAAQTLEIGERGVVWAFSQGGGDAGAIHLAAGSLALRDGGSITAGADLARGNAGTVDVTADSLLIESPVMGTPGGIDAGTRGATSAGSIRVAAREVSLLDGGYLSASAGPASSGDGGAVELDAESLRILGPGSGVFARALGSGNAGAVDLTSRSLEISEGGNISVGSRVGDAGSVDIEAGSVRIADQGQIDASILASSPGAGSAGTIRIAATDSVVLSGREGDRFSLLPVVLGLPLDDLTGIFSATRLGEAGGLVSIDAPQIAVSDGAIVAASTLGGGDGGSVRLTGERIRVSNGAFVDSTSVPVLAGSGAVEGGDAGAVTLEASESIEIAGRDALDPARVTSVTFGAGAAGDVTLRAPRIVVDGGAVATTTVSGSALGAAPGSGPGGQIVVDAGELLLLGGGQVSSTSLGEAERSRAGDIRITAGERISILGEGSGVESRAGGAGEGGDVFLRAPRIEIAEGGRVTAESTPGLGSVGQLFNSIVEDGLIDRDHIDAQAATGAAGRVMLQATELALRGGTIASDTSGTGSGGLIAIDARDVTLSGGAAVSSRSLGESAVLEAVPGDAGSIVIGPADAANAVRSLRLFEGSRIETQAREAGGGNITANLTGMLQLEQGSAIDASGVESDRGGNVRIGSPELGPTPQFVVLRDQSEILARAALAGGSGGTITVSARAGLIVEPGGVVDAANSVVLNAPEVTTKETIQRPETAFADPSQMLRPSCVAQPGQGSFRVVRRRGLPVSPEGLLIAFDELGGAPLLAAGEELEDEELPPVAAASGPDEEARRALAAGASAFRRGSFEEAKTGWAKAAAAGEGATRGAALRGLAQSQLALGEYGDSIDTLQQALNLAEAGGDPLEVAAALAVLGNAHLAAGDKERAAALFERGLSLAKESGEPGLAARLLNDLGNLEASRNDADAALRAYRESAAEAAEGSVVRAQAQANAARAALVLGRTEEAARLLASADLAAAGLPEGYAGVALRIHVARSYEALTLASASHATSGMLRAHGALMAAIRQAKTLGYGRLRSLALGNLAALYAREERIEEALYLARRAARAADAADAIDLLPRWLWLEGRLLWADGQAEAAVLAYQRAVDLLEETRQETLARYGGDVDFRRALAPVYLDLVDALLQGSARMSDAARSQALLRRARATMEKLKAAELRNYFRNECVAELEAKARPLEAVEGRTAVVYPILLPDRIELLVGTRDSGLARYPVAVDAARVRRTVVEFRRALVIRANRSYRKTAQLLYTWLVAPYAQALEAEGIDTLVFVPDGILRTIPMAALHDGQRFLVERYALAVAPSLQLVDPKPFDLAGAQLLLAGLSEPREVAGGRFEPLPFVRRELETIHARYGGELLLDDSFETARIEAALDQAPPTVVHLATHAIFTGQAASSFVLTADGTLAIDELGEAVRRSRFAREPLELLLLSACETAAGDERAALGLAGVAVRAGARSALGSLWAVSDEAAYALVVEFYRQLEQPGTTKARALQRAQQKLLSRRELAHPAYWAAFLLISNWL